jgi:F-type H+-transporting ATPase subunit alpha
MPEIDQIADDAFRAMQRARKEYRPAPTVRRVGKVDYVGPGVVRARGLQGVRSKELLRFPNGCLGMAFNVAPDQTGIVLLDPGGGIRAGGEVQRTNQVLEVPVGEALLGRVVDAMGRPMDAGAGPRTRRRLPMERPAPGIMDRLPVSVPLQTGLKVVDALIPVGRGQRELIIGDRQTGKTAIAVDTIINQKDQAVVCIYCAVGKRASAVAQVVSDLRARGSMDYTVVMVATENAPPGLQFVTPYAAAAVGEEFMAEGRDVLVVFDDLTRHARAYRELSLLLRRPPGREAYPGDIFYIHSRLLERATHLKDEGGGGSMTALPIVETEAQNISAYIPTNLISITDGQIYLDPELFRKGVLPAVDVGASVSRVGGKTQLPAYRAVTGDLRLSYSQFEELESFSRFGTQLDEETRRQLDRGRRIREILKQPQYSPIPVEEQVAVLVAASRGVFDDLPLEAVGAAERRIREAVSGGLEDVCRRIRSGEELSGDDLEDIAAAAGKAAADGRNTG